MEIPWEWTYCSSGTQMGTATEDIHIFSHGNPMGMDMMQLENGTENQIPTKPVPAPLYLRTLWRYTNAVIIIIIIPLCCAVCAVATWPSLNTAQ